MAEPEPVTPPLKQKRGRPRRGEHAITNARPDTAVVLAPPLRKKLGRGRPRKVDATPDPLPQVPNAEIEAPNPLATHEATLAQLTADDAELSTVLIAGRLHGMTMSELAIAFGLDVRRARRILRNARAAGACQDALVDLSHHALPLAIEKLIEKLHAGEYDAIKDTLKGLGAFRTFRQQDSTRDEHRTLEVRFVRPETPITLDARNIVGQPREVPHAIPVSRPTPVLSLPGSQEGRDLHQGRQQVGSREPRPDEPSRTHPQDTPEDDPLAACCE